MVTEIGEASEVIINNQKQQESKIQEVQTMISRQDNLIKEIVETIAEVKAEKASQAS